MRCKVIRLTRALHNDDGVDIFYKTDVRKPGWYPMPVLLHAEDRRSIAEWDKYFTTDNPEVDGVAKEIVKCEVWCVLL